MSGASVFLEAVLPPCPSEFNATAHCLGADGRGQKDALIAVQADGSVLRWSFDALRDRVHRAVGAYRALGVRKGDRVVLRLGDTPEFPVAYFAAIAAGAVAVPLSAALTEEEVAGIVSDIQPKVIVDRDMSLEGAHAPFAATAADDPAMMVFTSGSEGRPKGVLHAHRAFWARQSMHAGWHGIGPDDRVMHAGAFNWTYTLGVGLADTWSVGGTAPFECRPAYSRKLARIGEAF